MLTHSGLLTVNISHFPGRSLTPSIVSSKTCIRKAAMRRAAFATMTWMPTQQWSLGVRIAETTAVVPVFPPKPPIRSDVGVSNLWDRTGFGSGQDRGCSESHPFFTLVRLRSRSFVLILRPVSGPVAVQAPLSSHMCDQVAGEETET